jgi:hypothetical protein
MWKLRWTVCATWIAFFALKIGINFETRALESDEQEAEVRQTPRSGSAASPPRRFGDQPSRSMIGNQEQRGYIAKPVQTG